MDPSYVYYLSSDDDSAFERNQRLIREHHEQEDSQQIQDHLTRVLNEVKEGKRNFLRTAAIPELSSIPREIPLDQSLTVSVAYELSDFTFSIISQES